VNSVITLQSLGWREVMVSEVRITMPTISENSETDSIHFKSGWNWKKKSSTSDAFFHMLDKIAAS
jgi:hypothetical protein